MEFRYINEAEVTERLTKIRARSAIQQIYLAKYAGQTPDPNWVAEWTRLGHLLTAEEIDGFRTDVETSVMTQKETQVIQQRVEGIDSKVAEAETADAAVLIDTLKDLSVDDVIVWVKPIEIDPIGDVEPILKG